MLAVFAIVIFILFLIFFYPLKTPQAKEPTPKYKTQMRKLWSIAQSAMKESKPARAEKALLTILKFDEKNAAAYNRLGILYAKEEKWSEAIECFEIAQSIDNNPSSLHNVGLIYLETSAYEKAVIAFQQALELEGDVPSRFIALAKAQERLGNRKEAINALESAYDLDHSVSTLRQILGIYEQAEDQEAIAATSARIEAQIAADTAAKAARAAKKAKKTPVRKARTPKTKPRLSRPETRPPRLKPRPSRPKSRRRKVI